MVNIYKLGFTILQQEILRYLFIKAGYSFNARGLARPLDRTQAGIVKAIPELEKNGLIKVKQDKESGRWNIELNRENRKAIVLKRSENLKMVHEKVPEMKKDLVEFLEETFPGSTIILFGSYSKGEDTLGSDIDIAIIGSKRKDVKLTKFDKYLERTVRLHFYDSLTKLDKNLRSNILRGITLVGVGEI